VGSGKRTNDLAPLQQRLDDPADYYTIAYLPAKTEFDGKFHNIQVELEQRGYQLRYRGLLAMPRGQAIAMTRLPPSSFTFKMLFSRQSSDVFADLLLALTHGSCVGPFPGNKIPWKGRARIQGAMTLVVARDLPKFVVRLPAWLNVHLNEKGKD
jgi:hypothetical protein